MDFEIKFLSFYVIQVEGKDEQANKQFKHFQTLDTDEFEESELKDFLDGELKKIVKRKAERHPQSEQVPTKIGHFITEPGHELDSNPNYNLFNRARLADRKHLSKQASSSSVLILTRAPCAAVFLSWHRPFRANILRTNSSL